MSVRRSEGAVVEYLASPWGEPNVDSTARSIGSGEEAYDDTSY